MLKFGNQNQNEIDRFSNDRKGYHDRPEIAMCYTSADNDESKLVKIGVELETEPAGGYFDSGAVGDVDAICQNLSKAFNKKYNALFNYYNSDSSLNDYGIEIITQPFTRNFYEKTQADFTNLLNIAKENNLIAHDSGNCGIHVHINRAALGSTEEERQKNIDKIIYFFEYYKQDLKVFSRRKKWDYTRFLSDGAGYGQNISKALYNIKRLKSDADYSGHHRAVNLEHTETIEIRLFNSTLKPETFHAIIQFIFNLIELVKTHEIEDLNWYNLININMSGYLVDYLTAKNIKIDKKKIKRVDLEYLKTINSAFDKIQRMEIHILRGLLPYYKKLASIQADALKNDIKQINAINLKRVAQTSEKIDLKTNTEILKTFADLYKNTTKNREQVNGTFLQYLKMIRTFLLNHQKELDIDAERIDEIASADEYYSIISKLQEVM